jgi:hypothetical protein
MLYFYYFIYFYYILLYIILFIAELHIQPHLPRFYHNNTLLYYILSTLRNRNCKLHEDGVLTPKHVGVI